MHLLKGLINPSLSHSLSLWPCKGKRSYICWCLCVTGCLCVLYFPRTTEQMGIKESWNEQNSCKNRRRRSDEFRWALTHLHTHTQCYSIVAGDKGTRARDALLPQIRHREFDLETDSTVGSTGTGGRGYWNHAQTWRLGFFVSFTHTYQEFDTKRLFLYLHTQQNAAFIWSIVA